MIKKDTIPNILKDKINEEQILKKIIEEKSSSKRKNFGKGILIPVGVILILFLSLKIENNYRNLTNKKQTFELKENHNGQTNGENNFSYSQKDSRYESHETKEEIKLPFKLEKIPKDLIKTKNQILYELTTKEKKLIGVQKTFTSQSECREITFTIRKTEQVLENFNLNLKEKKYKITKKNEISLIEFNYQGNFIQMKTKNITEEEINSFLESI